MTERNCLKCQHCWIDSGSPAYSEYTPGTDPDMRCAKKHRSLPGFEYGREDMRRAFETAKECPDYEEDKA